jgi:hypothetical protein
MLLSAAVVKKIGVIAVIAVVAVLAYHRWANPLPDPLDLSQFPEHIREQIPKDPKRYREDMAGDLGQGAIRLCRARLGIKEPAQPSLPDMLRRGYSSEEGWAFVHCVVDLMYPVPDKH